MAACLVLATPTPGRAQTLQILTDDSPPVTLSRDGVPTGWAVNVVKEVERRVGETAEIRLVPWARAYRTGLREPNVVLFATMWTQDRNPLFEWVGPLQTLHLAFYGRPGDGLSIGSLEQARALKSIGVTRAFAIDQELTRMSFANLDRVERPTQMIEKLMTGRNQAFAGDDAFVSPEVLGRMGVATTAIEKKYEFETLDTYIAISKGTNPERVAAWRKAFAEMGRDGTLEKLRSGHD